MGRGKAFPSNLHYFARPPYDAVLWVAIISWIQEARFTIREVQEELQRRGAKAFSDGALRSALNQLAKNRLVKPGPMCGKLRTYSLTPACAEQVGWLMATVPLTRVSYSDVAELELHPEALPWLGKAFLAPFVPTVKFQRARARLVRDKELARIIRDSGDAVQAYLVQHYAELSAAENGVPLRVVIPLFDSTRGWPGDALPPAPPSVRRRGRRSRVQQQRGQRASILESPAALQTAAESSHERRGPERRN